MATAHSTEKHPAGHHPNSHRKTPPIERFWKKVAKHESGCWLWAGASLSYDEGYIYGQIFIDGKLKLAHVFSYEHFVGPIQEGLEIDHLCAGAAGVLQPGASRSRHPLA